MTTKYSEDHEWITVDGDIGTVGITDFAQQQLGDVVFVELPEVGATLDAGDEAGVVESVKAASEIYSPVSGQVTETNSDLEDAPDTVNSDAESDGWFFKIKLSDAAELDDLMDAAAYKTFCAEQG
jgi:glycine cleavage system H protein